MNKNKTNECFVPCNVSNRWLQFDDCSVIENGVELIEFSVMTLDKNSSPYRLFNLTISREDIENALNHITPINP